MKAVAILFAFALAGCSPEGAPVEPVAAAGAATSEAGLRLVPLTVVSDGAAHRFTVEVAASPEEQNRGLMFRTSLAPDAGMLFPFPAPKTASFWMKNTVIPLDIIFVRGDGTIESIAAMTTPYSTDPVTSGAPVAAVLELAGGRAGALGIAPGDRVEWAEPR